MNDSLLWTLVWDVAVHPRYEQSKRNFADRLHQLVLGAGIMGETRETELCGLMEVLAFLSDYILHAHGFATRWRSPRIKTDRYYPRRIEALALDFPYDDQPARQSNPLSGYRV